MKQNKIAQGNLRVLSLSCRKRQAFFEERVKVMKTQMLSCNCTVAVLPPFSHLYCYLISPDICDSV